VTKIFIDDTEVKVTPKSELTIKDINGGNIMTPCEKLGYKVGDRFVVNECVEWGGLFIFSEGSVVELFEDDGTNAPKFKLINGECGFNNADGEPGAYDGLDNVTKIEE